MQSGLGLDGNPSLSNLDIIILDVRRGSIIVDYQLSANNELLIETALLNINTSMGESVVIDDLVFEFSSNVEFIAISTTKSPTRSSPAVVPPPTHGMSCNESPFGYFVVNPAYVSSLCKCAEPSAGSTTLININDTEELPSMYSDDLSGVSSVATEKTEFSFNMTAIAVIVGTIVILLLIIMALCFCFCTKLMNNLIKQGNANAAVMSELSDLPQTSRVTASSNSQSHSANVVTRDSLDEGAMEVRNGVVACIAIGKYDHPNYVNLPVHRDVDNVREFSKELGYKFIETKRPNKLSWTKREIKEFMIQDVGGSFFKKSGKPKYDCLLVFVTGHGERHAVVTSDGQVVDREKIHRYISLAHDQIREIPRIFIFDACAGGASRQNTLSRLSLIQSHKKAVNQLSVSVESEEEMDDEDENAEEAHQDEAATNALTSHDSIANRSTEIYVIVDESDEKEELDKDQVIAKSASNVDDNLQQWTSSKKNPDHKLTVINSANVGFQAKIRGDEVGSFFIYLFTKKIIESIKKHDRKTLAEIMRDVQKTLEDGGQQLAEYTPNNGTDKLRLEMKIGKIRSVV